MKNMFLALMVTVTAASAFADHQFICQRAGSGDHGYKLTFPISSESEVSTVLIERKSLSGSKVVGSLFCSTQPNTGHGESPKVELMCSSEESQYVVTLLAPNIAGIRKANLYKGDTLVDRALCEYF